MSRAVALLIGWLAPAGCSRSSDSIRPEMLDMGVRSTGDAQTVSVGVYKFGVIHAVRLSRMYDMFFGNDAGFGESEWKHFERISGDAGRGVAESFERVYTTPSTTMALQPECRAIVALGDGHGRYLIVTRDLTAMIDDQGRTHPFDCALFRQTVCRAPKQLWDVVVAQYGCSCE